MEHRDREEQEAYCRYALRIDRAMQAERSSYSFQCPCAGKEEAPFRSAAERGFPILLCWIRSSRGRARTRRVVA